MRDRYNHLPSYKYTDVEGVKPVIEKSAGKPLRDYKIYGNSRQKNYGGKNLFDVFNQSYNGAYDRCSAEVLEDGTLRVTNKKVSAYTLVSCRLPYTLYDFKGKTITLSFKTKCSNENLYAGGVIRYLKEDGTTSIGIKEKFNYGSSAISITTTPSETNVQNYKYIVFNFYTNASSSGIGSVGDYVDFENIQLEIGDNATEFEPFIPAPSPESPKKINCVGEKTRNLFNVNKFIELVKTYDSTATETIEDGRRCISFRNDKLFHKDFNGVVDELESGNRYSWRMDMKFELSLQQTTENEGSIYLGWIYDDEEYNATNVANGSLRGSIRLNKSNYTNFKTITSPVSVEGRNVSQIGFSFGYPARWLIDLDSIQIEKGTLSTEYEPYGKYKIGVFVNSNSKSEVYNIFLDEPLRRVGEYCDYIDFKTQSIIRNVDVIDETGYLPITESYTPLTTPKVSTSVLPVIHTNQMINSVQIDTSTQPSNVKIQYYKKG